MVRGDLDGVLGLFDPPDQESGDDDVGNERNGEQCRGDVLYTSSEGGLAGYELGEFPDRHRDQCCLYG